MNRTGGLTSDSIVAVEQDRTGMIWIATDRGLNRFDGAGTQQFLHDPGDVKTLSGNRLSAIVSDSDGILWVGTTDAGLNRLDPITEDIRRYFAQPGQPGKSITSNEITALAESEGQFLWVGTRRGLDMLHLKSMLFREVPGIPAEAHVTTIYVHKQREIWVGTENGDLFRWNEEASDFEIFWTTGAPISAIAYDLKQGLWVGTKGQGLMRLDTKTGAVTPSTVIERDISSVWADSNGDLWAGTTSGLGRLDRATGDFVFFRNDPVESNSLSSNAITSVFEDAAKVLWVGTDGGGVNRFGLDRYWFPHYRTHPDDRGSDKLPHDSIWGMAPGRDGSIWIGTEYGLTHWFPETGQYETPELGLSGGEPYVHSILEAANGDVWVGTKGQGLIRFPEGLATAAIQYTHDPMNPESIGHDFVSELFEDPEGNIWIGTHGAGLWRFDAMTDSFYRVPSASESGTGTKNSSARFVASISRDSGGRIWVAASDGLHIVEPDSNLLQNYRA
ncbi:MAG: hypothetical protein HKN23_08090, partial [Verrucomicrobiales bacterium]|nr:hypothetical protein [Verrucomicrobiales bacterium]